MTKAQREAAEVKQAAEIAAAAAKAAAEARLAAESAAAEKKAVTAKAAEQARKACETEAAALQGDETSEAQSWLADHACGSARAPADTAEAAAAERGVTREQQNNFREIVQVVIARELNPEEVERRHRSSGAQRTEYLDRECDKLAQQRGWSKSDRAALRVWHRQQRDGGPSTSSATAPTRECGGACAQKWLRPSSRRSRTWNAWRGPLP